MRRMRDLHSTDSNWNSSYGDVSAKSKPTQTHAQVPQHPELQNRLQSTLPHCLSSGSQHRHGEGSPISISGVRHLRTEYEHLRWKIDDDQHYYIVYQGDDYHAMEKHFQCWRATVHQIIPMLPPTPTHTPPHHTPQRNWLRSTLAHCSPSGTHHHQAQPFPILISTWHTFAYVRTYVPPYNMLRALVFEKKITIFHFVCRAEVTVVLKTCPQFPHLHRDRQAQPMIETNCPCTGIDGAPAAVMVQQHCISP